MASAVIGACIGLLIGYVSGIVALAIIRFAWQAQQNWHILTSVVATLINLGGFWGGGTGGTWAGGSLLQVPDRLSMLVAYWVALLISFLLVTGITVAQLAIWSGAAARANIHRDIAGSSQPGGR